MKLFIISECRKLYVDRYVRSLGKIYVYLFTVIKYVILKIVLFHKKDTETT